MQNGRRADDDERRPAQHVMIENRTVTPCTVAPVEPFLDTGLDGGDTDTPRSCSQITKGDQDAAETSTPFGIPSGHPEASSTYA
jgi:hypothetical protein